MKSVPIKRISSKEDWSVRIVKNVKKRERDKEEMVPLSIAKKIQGNSFKQLIKDADNMHTNARTLSLQKQENDKINDGENFTQHITKFTGNSMLPKMIDRHRMNIREVLLCSNATPIACGGLSYGCSFCNDQFPNPRDLKQHTLETHHDDEKRIFNQDRLMYAFIVKLDITNLKCNLCNTEIDTLDDLFEHLIVIHDRNIDLEINNHIIPYKFDDENLKCVICQNICFSFKSLQEHMNIHFRNYVCDECSAGFVNQAMLKRHKSVHIEAQSVTKYNCELCPKVFATEGRKRVHIKVVHTHNVNIKCRYCDETFQTYNERFRHLKDSHGVQLRKYACFACERTFANKGALSKHTKRNHLMERSHECSYCDSVFYSSGELKLHIVKHTGVKAFKCEVCDKCFGRQKSLRQHLRIHFNDRRFGCEICGQRFIQKCSLTFHMLSKHSE